MMSLPYNSQFILYRKSHFTNAKHILKPHLIHVDANNDFSNILSCEAMTTPTQFCIFFNIDVLQNVSWKIAKLQLS